MKWTRMWCVVGCVMCCLHITSAQAQEKDLKGLSASEKETIVTFVKAGRDAFEEGRYDKALRAFDEAYFIHPLTELLYRIAQCHENLGHASQAAEFYAKYLEYADDLEDEKLTEIKDKITKLEQLKETKLTVRTDPADARVLIDGQFAGRAPQTVSLAETSIELRLEAEGYAPITQTIELEPGIQKELFFALQLERTIEQPPEKPGLSGKQKGGIGLMAGGGAILIGGAVIGLIGAQTRASLEGLDRSMARPGDYNERYERANFRSTLGLGLAGAGLALTGVGAYLFFGSSSSEDAGARLELLPTHRGAAARVRF